MLVYVTGSQRLTPQRTECKHILFNTALMAHLKRICPPNSFGWWRIV